jgi:transcriptional antiterminator RfaH
MDFWACAQLQPRRENLALGGLKLRGYEVFCPRILERRRVRGRREATVEVMLFPLYVFVAIVAGRWYDAVAVPGVNRLIGHGTEPSHVPDRVIDEIRKRERDGVVELPQRGLALGDHVRVTSGPFYDHIGLYAGQPARERVTVLLAILGAHQRVTLPAANVEPAG